MKYFEEINEVPAPTNVKIPLDTIDLSEEDVGTIVYEVVNAKAKQVLKTKGNVRPKHGHVSQEIRLLPMLKW